MFLSVEDSYSSKRRVEEELLYVHRASYDLPHDRAHRSCTELPRVSLKTQYTFRFTFSNTIVLSWSLFFAQRYHHKKVKTFPTNLHHGVYIYISVIGNPKRQSLRDISHTSTQELRTCYIRSFSFNPSPLSANK